MLHLAFSKYFTDFKRNVVVSSITILFLLHPTLTSTALGMFQCIQIDDDISKVRIDLEMECYSLEHVSWCALIAVPMLIVWVFGCPVFAFIALYRNRHRLNDTSFQRYFIVLFQGLKDDKFYWEIVNTFRKVLIVSINVFMAQFPLFYKGSCAIILLIIFIRIQMYLKPFKLHANNECELLSFTGKLFINIIASAMTLFGGLLYVSEGQRVGIVDLLAFLFILLANLYFMFLWAYLLSYNMHRFSFARKFSKIMQTILFRKSDANNPDLHVRGPSKMKSIENKHKRPVSRRNRKYD